MNVNVKISSRTDKGKVRENNEDYLDYDVASRIAILADGMGGLNAGEVAAKQTVTKIMRALKAQLPIDISERQREPCEALLERVIDGINGAVFEMSNSHYDYYGMGTTLVVAVQLADEWLLAHVGDSRIYHFTPFVADNSSRLDSAGESRPTPSSLIRATRDHSLVQQLLDEGVLTEEEARRSPNRNIITRAVGIGAEVKCETGSLKLAPGELLLMCSDGLSDMIDDAAIAAHCALNVSDPDALSQNLLDSANAAGGTDNISIIVICA